MTSELPEQKLLEKLRLIEALHSGAATDGERNAAASARDRIRERLRAMQAIDPPIEYRFGLQNPWSVKLFTALLRRYDIKPFRYPRQRYTTLMARVPRKFVDQTLWPEFTELDNTLNSYLNEVTQRVIREGITTDDSDVEVRPEPLAIGQVIGLESGPT